MTRSFFVFGIVAVFVSSRGHTKKLVLVSFLSVGGAFAIVVMEGGASPDYYCH